MHSADADHDTVLLVPGAHRVIRLLDPHEGPYAGTLVTDRESVAVSVDADALGGWAGWAHAGDEHVAGPVDIVRRGDGHDVLLPWCTERVSVFLGRREAAADVLSPGETSTLVGSLLRGLDELGRSASGTEAGEWWLSDHGRPLFVIGAGDDARAAAARVVDGVRRGAVDRTSARLLASIRDGLHKDVQRPGVPSRQLRLWEAELYAIAAPRPLRRDTHAPERVRNIEMARSLRVTPLETRREARAAARDGEPRHLSGLLPTIGAAALASLRAVERVIAAGRLRLTAARRDARGLGSAAEEPGARRVNADAAPSRPRRRLIVAGGAAAVILVGGLLWPGGATGGSPAAGGSGEKIDPAVAADATGQEYAGGAATASPSEPAAAATGTPESSPDPTPGGAGLGDPVDAATALLSLIRECADRGDDACVEAVVPGSSAVRDVTSTQTDGGKEQIALVDAYGDVAVVRVSGGESGETDAPAGSERMLVLVRLEDKWLVRDAYDVADQPR